MKFKQRCCSNLLTKLTDIKQGNWEKKYTAENKECGWTLVGQH